MKAYRGSRGIAPALAPGDNSDAHWTESRLGQVFFRTIVGRENSLVFTRKQALYHPARSLVTMSTELPRLLTYAIYEKIIIHKRSSY
jgi:hypothetical protein